MKFSRRLDRIPPYLFVEINRKIAQKRAQGEKVISFAIGDPDIPTPHHIVQRLCDAAHEPKNHRYPETDGLPELRKAIASWYGRRFNIALDSDKQVLPLIGSKEGIAHMAMCFIDPGDVALVPDPGYPVYSMGTILAGGTPHYMPLLEKNGFLPDLEDIPDDVVARAKVLWINYPNNPTGATAEPEFYSRVVSFARKHDIAVCHDGPYSEVAYDGYRPASFLQVPGAMDVGVEFHSWSKTYNMTGWRIGMAVGNADMIRALMTVKSNMDSGIFQAVQEAAIAALEGDQECIHQHNVIYQRRRDRIIPVLRELGLYIQPPRGGLYIWARVPEGHTSVSFTTTLLDQTGVAVTPGTGYGPNGEGYVRLSISLPDADLEEAVTRLRSWKAGKAGSGAGKSSGHKSRHLTE